MSENLFALSNYRFNPHAVPVVAVSILIFSIGLFIFFQVKKVIKNVAFFFLCASLSLWLLGTGLVYLANNPRTALLWYKYLTFLGVVNIMPSAYLFSVASSGFFKKQRKFIVASFILAYLFYLLAIVTDKFITSPRLYFWGYYPVYQPLNFPFLICYCVIFVAIQLNLWLAYRREIISVKKAQVLIIAVSFLIGFTASADFVAKIWNVSWYPFGFVPIFIFVCLLAYSIIRYKAFDIETVIHKTAMWFLTFSIIIIPVFLLYRWTIPYLKGSSFLQAAFWILSFLALAYYLRVIQPKIDHAFRRRQSNLEEISNRFTEDLVHLKGLNQLIQRIEDTIADTLYPQHIDIFIYNEAVKDYKLVNAIRSLRGIIELKGNDQFLMWLAKNNKIVYRDFIEIDPKYASIKERAEDYFNSMQAMVVIPLILNEKLLGVINLGKKANLKRYSAADFHFLTALKNQSTIAISNSLLYENMEERVRQRTKELMDVQRQLIQAEKLATMGTLAGGVAHEINNPLTAILTNVQMLLADTKSFDLDSKESLELIEEATKRCRTIVQKLMAYAKRPLETTEISKVDLLTVTKNVISFLGYQLEQDNIKIITNAKENDYTIMGNQNELEQVLTNIILNARDAIKQIKKGGNIQIRLFKSDDRVNVEIEDEGKGISKEIMPKIFDPFFTTKDVGKGTGLGLSICQAIVEKHKGLITAQSEINKGSIFTIKIPAAKQESVLKA